MPAPMSKNPSAATKAREEIRKRIEANGEANGQRCERCIKDKKKCITWAGSITPKCSTCVAAAQPCSLVQKAKEKQAVDSDEASEASENESEHEEGNEG